MKSGFGTFELRMNVRKFIHLENNKKYTWIYGNEKCIWKRLVENIFEC
jgi:hypothetical protein